MDDTRRFFRYIIPGLTFIIEISLYFALSHFDTFRCVILKLMVKDNSVGFTLALFIASGGLGFLLGILYHFLYWLPCIRGRMVNHESIIRNMIEKQWLQVVRYDNNTVVQPKEIFQSGAWRILTAYWHFRRKEEIIDSANERIDSVGNTMHGLGTACVGSILAFLIWLVYYFPVCFTQWYFLWLVPMGISIVHYVNYKDTVEDYSSLVNIIVTKQIQIDISDSSKPIVIYVSDKDLSEKYPWLNELCSKDK